MKYSSHGVASDPFWVGDNQSLSQITASFRHAHTQCIVPPRTGAPDASCPIVNLLNVYILRLIWVVTVAQG